MHFNDISMIIITDNSLMISGNVTDDCSGGWLPNKICLQYQDSQYNHL